MQRRAAALYAAFFLLVAAGAYGTLGMAEEPAISLESPEYTVSSGQTFTVDDRTYNTSVNGESAELVWVNESARYVETWEASVTEVNDTAELGYLAGDDVPTVTYRNGTYRAILPESDGEPSSFYLVETRSIPDNATTVTVDGTEYVLTGSGDDREFIPAEVYLVIRFGQPTILELEERDTLPYQNNTTTVTSVTNSSVELSWTAPRENTVSVGEGDTTTLNGREFVAHFEGGQLQLSTDVAAYEEQVQVQENHGERVNGLWGVSILSGLAAVLLLSMAFLPSRY